MSERVQQLISDALPLLHACQAQRVKRVLEGTRAHVQTYFRAHEQLRAQRLHSTSTLHSSCACPSVRQP